MPTPTMVWKGRITKQGVRDLNYYGPRREKGVEGAPAAATVAGADEKSAPEARPPVSSASEAHEEDASK